MTDKITWSGILSAQRACCRSAARRSPTRSRVCTYVLAESNKQPIGEPPTTIDLYRMLEEQKDERPERILTTSRREP